MPLRCSPIFECGRTADGDERDMDEPSGVDVVFTPAARRAVAEMPITVGQAALALINGDLAAHPLRVGEAVRAPLEGLYSARRRDYRTLYRVNGERVTIVDVRHRRDAYRS